MITLTEFGALALYIMALATFCSNIYFISSFIDNQEIEYSNKLNNYTDFKNCHKNIQMESFNFANRNYIVDIH